MPEVTAHMDLGPDARPARERRRVIRCKFRQVRSLTERATGTNKNPGTAVSYLDRATYEALKAEKLIIAELGDWEWQELGE